MNQFARNIYRKWPFGPGKKVAKSFSCSACYLAVVTCSSKLTNWKLSFQKFISFQRIVLKGQVNVDSANIPLAHERSGEATYQRSPVRPEGAAHRVRLRDVYAETAPVVPRPAPHRLEHAPLLLMRGGRHASEVVTVVTHPAAEGKGGS